MVDQRTTDVVQEGLGAWDLTSDARLAFRFFSLAPNQLPSLAGTHDDVPIIEWLHSLATVQIHTPSYDLWQDRGLSGTRHPSTLTSDSSPNVYSQQGADTIGLVAALGC